MNALYKAFTAGALMLVGTAANAIVVSIGNNLTLVPEGAPGIQQASQGPCIIGDPSCNNSLGFTLLPTAGNPTSYLNTFSPVYNLGTFRAAAGDFFAIGIDINRQGNAAANNSHYLNTFVALINGVQTFAYTGGANLGAPANNNGNGFSDWRLTGFNISSYLDSATIQFGLDLASVNAGRDQFFVIAGPRVPKEEQPIPEASSLALLGLGLLGVGFGARKRKTK